MNSDRRNYLLICSDQHSRHVLGCYGNSIVDTPNLDRLAAQGTRFSDAYCNQPICVPSRMSFMTGLQPFNCNCHGNGSILDSRLPTYATMLACSGYHTVLSGRMHFIGPDQRHGFVERLVGDVSSYGDFRASTGERWEPLPPDLGNMSTHYPLTAVGAGHTAYLDYDADVTAASIDWLRRYAAHADDVPPFMMTVGYITPHCPYIAPPELVDKYYDRVSVPDLDADELARLHAFHHDYRKAIRVEEISAESLHRAAAAYYALVEYLDTQIGLLLDALDEAVLTDSTTVVYFSDHGEMLGEHGRWHKGCFYEGSVGVPLIVREPGAPGGRTVGSLVSLVDLFPTLCEWVDCPVSARTDGRSLVPLLADPEGEWDNLVRAEYYSMGDAYRMVRRGNWKFCFYGGYDRCELFNLQDDPGELDNRADDPALAGLVAELRDLVFADGWDENVLRREDAWLAEHGYYQWLQAWRRQVSKDPLLPLAGDTWRGYRRDHNWLRDG